MIKINTVLKKINASNIDFLQLINEIEANINYSASISL